MVQHDNHRSPRSPRVLTRAGIALAVGVLAAAALSACVPEPGTAPTRDPGAVSTPSASPSIPAPSQTTAPPETSEQPTAVAIPCFSVVDAQTMYDFNPNFGLLASFAPSAGSLAARATADKGTVCRWSNQTSGDTVDVTISRPGSTAFTAAKGAARTGTPVSGLGDAAYFSTSGGAGVVQVFDGPFWITATSVYFSSADDANGIMRAAVAAAR
jgi:hypothetical protein